MFKLTIFTAILERNFLPYTDNPIPFFLSLFFPPPLSLFLLVACLDFILVSSSVSPTDPHFTQRRLINGSRFTSLELPQSSQCQTSSGSKLKIKKKKKKISVVRITCSKREWWFRKVIYYWAQSCEMCCESVSVL